MGLDLALTAGLLPLWLAAFSRIQQIIGRRVFRAEKTGRTRGDGKVWSVM